MPAPPFTSKLRTGRLPEPDPPPPPPPPGRTVRVAARVVLWTLIGIASLHGILPPPLAPGESRSLDTPARSSLDLDPLRSRPQASVQDQLAMATAAAFLHEYLTTDTIDGRRAERPGRLKRYLARGVDLDDGVVPERGASQVADLVLPAGSRSVKEGLEVTVFAHLLRTREGPTRDGGMVAFVVPMVSGPRGFAVAGIPRPAALPIDPGLTSRDMALPEALARATAIAAGRAVAAVLNGDRDALVRLGGGVAPVIRPFPDGWRPVGITMVQPLGPPETPTARVLVRARPPLAGIEYLVPVLVSLRPGAGTATVREVDAGGAP